MGATIEERAALASFFGQGGRYTIWRAGELARQAIDFGLGTALTALTRLFKSADVQVKTLDIATPNWPSDYPKLRVAILSDFHVGSPHMSADKLRQVVEQTNKQRPDVVLLLGDYLNQDEDKPKNTAAITNGEVAAPAVIADCLKGLKANGGVYAVLGNHDWYQHGPEMRDALTQVGIRVLENDAQRVTMDGRDFWIAGMDDHSQKPDYAPIARKIGDDPVIVATHNPRDLEKVAGSAALMTAGHTHGGQVAIGWVNRLARMPLFQKIVGAILPAGALKELKEHTDWPYGHQVVKGNDAYVTSGLGTSTVPLRYNMPPEIAVVDIEGTGAPGKPAGTRPRRTTGPGA